MTKRVFQVAVWLASVSWLSADAVGVVQFVVFLLGVLLPALSLIATRLLPRSISGELQLPAAFASFCMLLIPVFLLRKLVPLPLSVIDSGLMVGLVVSAWRTGAFSHFLRSLKANAAQCSSILLVVIPALFCLAWTGFEFSLGDSVCYSRGMNDFANLASFVALVKVSPLLPVAEVSGGGPFSYHWFYFVLPACLSDFLGRDMRCSTALVLSNLAVASVFFMTLTVAARSVLPDGNARSNRIAVLAAALVAFAPSIFSIYLRVAHWVDVPWFGLGTRNQFLMPNIDSMLWFGNNTLGLTIVLLVFSMVEPVE